MQETEKMRVWFLGQEDGGTAIHSSILVWRIPWAEPDWLQYIGSQRVGHNWATELNWTEELKSLLKKVKEESEEVGLKLNI